jgi:hypothetical protein
LSICYDSGSLKCGKIVCFLDLDNKHKVKCTYTIHLDRSCYF